MRERRGRKHLTGQRKRETEMMRETVGGRRMILSLLQEAREDVTEEKSPAIAKMGRNGTVAAGTFRRRDRGDGKEGESKPHIPRLLGR